MAWSGLGINYGHHSPNNPYDMQAVDEDLKHIRALGYQWISIAMPNFGSNTALGVDNSQQLAIRAKQHGFKVAWGTIARFSNTYNLTDWNSFLTNDIQKAAAWANANDIDEWHMGNEHENRGVFISSITHLSGTATVTTQFAHGFTTGDTVSMIWVQPAGFAGDFSPITVTSPTTFTFACDAGLPATGSSDPGVTGRCRNYTNATIFQNICDKATELKATYPNLKMAYRSSGSKIPTWNARNNLGGLDYIGFNIYGYPNTIYSQLKAAYDKWGNKTMVTEWSTDGGFFSRVNNTEDRWQDDLDAVQKVIRSFGIDKAFYFCYRDGGFGVTANSYALMRDDNKLRLAAQSLTGGRKWLV